jgi:hypothetical protein
VNARALAIAAISILAGSRSWAAEQAPLVVFRGNLALTEEVYRAVLNLPPEARATPPLAQRVRYELLSFLHRSGYDLATVEAHVAGDQIAVDLDEGQLDKVLFLDEDAFHTIRLRIQLMLPHDIFNRLVLERQLGEMVASHQITHFHWEIVPVNEPNHFGPQIDKIPELPAIGNVVELIPRHRPYELHIKLDHPEWSSGWGLEITINGLEGVGAGFVYRDGGLAIEHDRWEARTRAATFIRTSLDQTSSNLVLTAALAEGRWFTPPILGADVRTFLGLRAYFLNRQRKDLNLESFYYAPFESSVNLEWTMRPRMTLSLGGGGEYRLIFHRAPSTVPNSPVPQVVLGTPTNQSRWFASTTFDLGLNPTELRKDRAHQLRITGRLYGDSVGTSGATEYIDGSYQLPISVGWHELWIRSRGTIIAGDVLFPDEVPMGGDYLRGPFSSAFYTHRIASASAEFRISLVRDLFKVSVYHDLAIFGAQDINRTEDRAALANALGIGFHALLIESFELDMYIGIGWATGLSHPLPSDSGNTQQNFDRGFVLAVKQAY